MEFFSKLQLRFLGAVQFLTVIPVSRSTVPVHESAPFFPFVGAIAGLLSSLPMAWLPLPSGIEAAITLSIQLLLTGMLHEDGLADIADGVRAGRTREKMFEIIKDSRVGTYGASALCVALILRWQGLALVADHARSPWTIMALVAASEGLSRCAILWLGLVTPAARQGMGAYLSEHCGKLTTVASLLQATLFVSFLDLSSALWLLGGLMAMVALARHYFMLRLGGVVGDCFGALQQACVIYCLVVYAWPNS